MNTPPPMSLSPVMWYYMGQDDQEHGPFDSARMILWSNSGYFNDMLMVRTENDSKYYPLVEWTRLCGNQLPFIFPVIVSMDSLLMDRMNALNLAHHGGQMPPPPPAPTMANPMRIFSSGPISVAPPPAPTGPIMVSFPTGMPPPPPQNAQVFSPNQQFIYTKQAQTVPGFPPFAMVNNSMYVNSIHPESENPSSTVSNTPDSEPMNESPPHADKKVDTMDAPWARYRVERGTSPIRMLNQTSKETQTTPIKVSAQEASRLLAGMLKTPIEIVFDHET